jgi:hypothetical protein
MCDKDFGTLYLLVARDLTTGTRKPVQAPPIRGRYPAQEQLERVRRENRDPRIHYELERTTALRDPDEVRGLRTLL